MGWGRGGEGAWREGRDRGGGGGRERASGRGFAIEQGGGGGLRGGGGVIRVSLSSGQTASTRTRVAGVVDGEPIHPAIYTE